MRPFLLNIEHTLLKWFQFYCQAGALLSIWGIFLLGQLLMCVWCPTGSRFRPYTFF